MEVRQHLQSLTATRVHACVSVKDVHTTECTRVARDDHAPRLVQRRRQMDMETEDQTCEAQPSLSDDLLMRILALLELHDLALCGMVSRDWARVTGRDELWMPFGRLVNNRVPGLTWKQCVHACPRILASSVPQ